MYKAIFFAVSQKTTKEKSTQDGLPNRFRIYEKKEIDEISLNSQYYLKKHFSMFRNLLGMAGR